MNVTVNYSDVLERCKMLSSFEGRNHNSPTGESDYLKIKIMEQDEPLMKDCIMHGANAVENSLGEIISNSEYNDSSVTYTLDVDTERWVKTDTLNKQMVECVCLNAMQEWLSYNGSPRSEAYQSIYEEMRVTVLNNITKKKIPTL